MIDSEQKRCWREHFYFHLYLPQSQKSDLVRILDSHYFEHQLEQKCMELRQSLFSLRISEKISIMISVISYNLCSITFFRSIRLHTFPFFDKAFLACILVLYWIWIQFPPSWLITCWSITPYWRNCLSINAVAELVNPNTVIQAGSWFGSPPSWKNGSSWDGDMGSAWKDWNVNVTRDLLIWGAGRRRIIKL